LQRIVGVGVKDCPRPFELGANRSRSGLIVRRRIRRLGLTQTGEAIIRGLW